MFKVTKWNRPLNNKSWIQQLERSTKHREERDAESIWSETLNRIPASLISMSMTYDEDWREVTAVRIGESVTILDDEPIRDKNTVNTETSGILAAIQRSQKPVGDENTGCTKTACKKSGIVCGYTDDNDYIIRQSDLSEITVKKEFIQGASKRCCTGYPLINVEYLYSFKKDYDYAWMTNGLGIARLSQFGFRVFSHPSMGLFFGIETIGKDKDAVAKSWEDAYECCVFGILD